MKVQDFLQLYQNDSLVQTLFEYQKTPAHKIHLKGMAGSTDSVLLAATFALAQKESALKNQTYVCILRDRDEAAYFANDLQNLLPAFEVALFPTSYKRPYEFEEVENANVLMRAEVLNKINQKNDSLLIATYPEALSEKVVNKQSLLANTFSAKVGEEVDLDFLAEVLVSYDFQKVDFVYEAGQFAIRGGIVDIYSFAHELPYRLELFGNEIESIRIFEPDSQLSVKEAKHISIVPNVHNRLEREVRESFLDFIPSASRIWLKDVSLTLDLIDASLQKVQDSFQEILQKTGHGTLVSKPEELFETKANFLKSLETFTCIEFGNIFYFKANETLNYQTKPQPSFNKNFEMLTEDLRENQGQQFLILIVSESYRQIERLRSIFFEIDPLLKVEALVIGLREGFIDKHLNLLCYTDHQIFERFYRYKIKQSRSKSKALTLKELKNLQPGDYVTHIDYGVGRFTGLEKKEVNGKSQDVIRLVYRDNDLLYVNVHSLHKIAKYSGKEAAPPSISKLGSSEWDTKKKKVKRKVQDIAKELIKLYAKRKQASGFAYSADSYLQAELETSFLYEDTPDQAKATQDVKADMEVPSPMDRLICGDVGFGKTEIAIRAAFKAVTDGKQVAVLVPTTVLAMQHYRTFANRLQNLPCKVAYINRFKSTTQIKSTLKELSEGKVDILIGTHRIVNKDVKFKDLGLLVIDEEQKFGVKTKDKLKEMRVNVDVLTLTATPIPRTLNFSLMGARDLSIIATPPPNRQPVNTEVHNFNENIIRDAISFELQRGGQVFFVHNRVGDIDAIGNLILRLVPDARIGVAHGQMDGTRLEKVMMKFIDGDYDILVSTNIIESGLDIPNANTIIINMAHSFGLSDLHQMRGRVGRSNRKAFCYLLTPSSSGLTSDSRKRLQTLEEFSDLGDGFKVAMRDMDIRGAGNILGSEQSGFISDLGFETYHKILDDAIQELKETEFKELFEKELTANTKLINKECHIETDLETLLPEDYIENISERLSLYNELDNLKEEEELQKFQKSLLDRFGPLPPETEELLKTVRLRWLAREIGLEKLTIKNEKLKGYFISDNEQYFNSEQFGKVLTFMQQNPKLGRLKEHKGKPIMVFENIHTIQQGIDILSALLSR